MNLKKAKRLRKAVYIGIGQPSGQERNYGLTKTGAVVNTGLRRKYQSVKRFLNKAVRTAPKA